MAARKTAGDFGARASQIPWFFVGWALSIVVCAGLDTIALTFTAPELLGPLSGVTLVLNTWVAQLINGERVFALDGAVTVLILTGAVTTILNGPTGTLVRVDEHFLWAALHRPAFLVYAAMMLSSALAVSYCTVVLYGDRSPTAVTLGRAARPKLSMVSPLLYPVRIQPVQLRLI